MKIAFRKSAKMIVRGRSPGHYQSERRGSASSGPGGSGPSLGGYSSSQMIGDYSSGGGSSVLQGGGNGSGGGGGGYGTGGYAGGGGYAAATRPHDLSLSQPLDTSRNYSYYAAPIYDSHDPTGGIAMFSHKPDHESSLNPLGSILDHSTSRVKHESEGTLPSIYQPGPAYYNKSYNKLEGKASSAGLYPTMLPQPS
jgi:meiosis-specific transcription factor NDT80